MEVGGPGCFGTGPLAASACSEVPPYPPGTTSPLNFTFHLFPDSQILHFSHPGWASLPFPPSWTSSLSTHYPCTVPTALQGSRRVAQARRKANPASCLVIGRNRRQLFSHWSPLAAAGAWGEEGTDCNCGEKGVSKNLQKSSRNLQKSASVCPADFRLRPLDMKKHSKAK